MPWGIGVGLCYYPLQDFWSSALGAVSKAHWCFNQNMHYLANIEPIPLWIPCAWFDYIFYQQIFWSWVYPDHESILKKEDRGHGNPFVKGIPSSRQIQIGKVMMCLTLYFSLMHHKVHCIYLWVTYDSPMQWGFTTLRQLSTLKPPRPSALFKRMTPPFYGFFHVLNLGPPLRASGYHFQSWVLASFLPLVVLLEEFGTLDLQLHPPSLSARGDEAPPSHLAMYKEMLKAGLRFPLSPFILKVLHFYGISLRFLTPNSIWYIVGF